MVNFEEFNGKKPASTYYQTHDQDETCDGDLDDYFHQPEKKRLTVDQVQFLERSFEVENKLEPERKIQLAKDLGLQPRQLAIWFQNRRARWKAKQLEKDYEALKANYNMLKDDYENLLKKREKTIQSHQAEQSDFKAGSDLLEIIPMKSGRNCGKFEFIISIRIVHSPLLQASTNAKLYSSSLYQLREFVTEEGWRRLFDRNEYIYENKQLCVGLCVEFLSKCFHVITCNKVV